MREDFCLFVNQWKLKGFLVCLAGKGRIEEFSHARAHKTQHTQSLSLFSLWLVSSETRSPKDDSKTEPKGICKLGFWAFHLLPSHL